MSTETLDQDRILTPGRAGREAVMWEMKNSKDVFFLGEDVVHLGGVYNTATGLAEEFPGRVIDTPISEEGFVGMAAGAAIMGMRPIIEIAFSDFLLVCMNPLANYIAKTHYMSAGQLKVPLVLLCGEGGGYNNGAEQSQSIHGTLAHFPGLKVVAPSNAYNAKGLMHAAIRDDNPVVLMYNKATMGVGWLGPAIPTIMTKVPEDDYTVALDKAEVMRQGKDITLVGVAWTVHQCLQAADELEKDGISAEVIDLRSLSPIDYDTIVTSVRKTGRLIVADEDYSSYGMTAEVITGCAERDISMFKAAPQRVAYPNVPPPAGRTMENYCLPSADKIVAAAKVAVS